MSSANVEIARAIFALWERGDFSSDEWAHPDIEFVIIGGAERGSGRGVAAMAEVWRDFLGAWEELRVEAEEYRECDGNRVLVLTRNSGRGRTSGLELDHMETRGANLFQIRNGKVVRLVLYWDRERAFADLGLAPKPDSPDS